MSSAPIPGSHLAELLACERELEEQHVAAEAEARRRIEEARAEAERAGAALTDGLEREIAELRASIRAETQARLREVTAAAAEQVRRIEAVDRERILALAESAYRRLVDGEHAP